MAKLTIKGLQKRYKGTEILKDINFEAEDGEFVVLVGPSGCGKSTLLRTIAGLETVTAGEIYIGDNLVNDMSPAERNIAMVFQDYALYPHMRVRENLTFGLKNRGISPDEIDRRVGYAAQILELEPLLRRKPSQLSGGQRQRVAIGRAIVRKPLLFLFDEPLSNLDAQLRAQTRIEIAALHRQVGSTSVYVTHDQTEAMTLADRIVVLHRGRVQQVGSPMELYHRPRNKFVGSFIGSPGMSFLDGHLVHGNGRSYFRMGEVVLNLPAEVKVAAGAYSLGVRPEGFVVATVGESQGESFSARVLMTELHGFELHIIAEVAGQQITVRSTDEGLGRELPRLRAGAKLALQVKADALHWFEQGEEGRRIG